MWIWDTVPKNLRHAIAQKSENLNYTTAEAWSFYQLCWNLYAVKETGDVSSGDQAVK